MFFLYLHSQFRKWLLSDVTGSINCKDVEKLRISFARSHNHKAKHSLWTVPGRARPLCLLLVTCVNGRVTNQSLDKTRHWRNSLPMKSLVEATPGGLRPRCWKAAGSGFTRTACVIWDSAVKFTVDGPFFFWTHITNGVHAAPCEVPTTEWKQWACRRFHHTLMGSSGSHWAHKAAARSSDQYGKAKFTLTIQLEMNSWIIDQYWSTISANVKTVPSFC